MLNKNTVLALLMTAAASMGGTVVTGADNTDHWTSTRLARQRKLEKAHSGGGGGTNAATPAAAAPIRDLFVQPGIGCHITKHGSGSYFLSATVGTETTYFSERPKRTAGTIATHEFVDRFAYIFATSNPNAAVTFTGNKDSTMTAAADNNRPLIVELSPPLMYYTNMDSSIIYPITQSKSQGEVVPMDQFLEMSDVSCSIFVDNGDVSSTGCPPGFRPYECADRVHCLPCFTLDLPEFQTTTNCTNELVAIAGTALMTNVDSNFPCPTPPPTLPPLPIPQDCATYSSGITAREVGCRLPKASCPPTGRADGSQCTPGCAYECENSCVVTGSNTRYVTSPYYESHYDKDGGPFPFDVGICENGNHESIINKLDADGDMIVGG